MSPTREAVIDEMGTAIEVASLARAAEFYRRTGIDLMSAVSREAAKLYAEAALTAYESLTGSGAGEKVQPLSQDDLRNLMIGPATTDEIIEHVGRNFRQKVNEIMSEKSGDETGWLIERNDLGAPQWLQFGPQKGYTTFTTDASKALRFARKCDADAFLYHHEHRDPALRLTEHKWLGTAPSPAVPEGFVILHPSHA